MVAMLLESVLILEQLPDHGIEGVHPKTSSNDLGDLSAC